MAQSVKSTREQELKSLFGPASTNVPTQSFCSDQHQPMYQLRA
jgi:hypothetical protein